MEGPVRLYMTASGKLAGPTFTGGDKPNLHKVYAHISNLTDTKSNDMFDYLCPISSNGLAKMALNCEHEFISYRKRYIFIYLSAQ